MNPQRDTEPANPARETASKPSPGLDAAWGQHPLLGRMLSGQRRHQRMEQRFPWLRDTVLVLIISLISLPDLLSDSSRGPFGETGNPHHLPLGALFAFAAALIVPLWWRRKAPATAFFVIALVSVVQWSFGIWQAANISVLVALYSLALYGSLRMLGWAGALMVVEVILAAFILFQVTQPLLGAFFLLGTATAALATGLTVRMRTMYVAALEERARRLEVERDQRVRLTAAAERSRVAREMHDIVGHNLSVMVSLADGAAALAASRSEQSAETLRILGDTGRQAMDELRRSLGVLRDAPNEARELSPQPTIRELDALLARTRTAGLVVTYRTVGDLDSLSSGLQLTVYRIVQEALTNTLKHAGTGSSADITVQRTKDTVHVRVADTGPPQSGPAFSSLSQPLSPDDTGNGLVGIRQRAALYGGAVTIGPRGSGPGWIVDVELDVSSAPIQAESGESPS